MSVDAWEDFGSYPRVTADESKIWISISDSSLAYSNRIWSSTDGISWEKSLGTTPDYVDTPDLVAFDNALWRFFPINNADGECWKSLNDGDSWAQVSTNVPINSSHCKVIEHENKLWLFDQTASSSTVMWSADGIEWNSSWYTKDSVYMEAASLIGLPNGRLWLYTGNSYGTEPSFYYIGGPKKQDGLYYYRKD